MRAFPIRYRSPERLRAACRSAADGRELKRVTDADARTPFSAYNLRLYRQTYHGIRDLLLPLVQGAHARVLPMQSPWREKPSLMEVCPASTLKRLGLYQPYKGRSIAHRRARGRILKALERAGLLLARAELRGPILSCAGGDALDSVIAALAAHRAWRSGAWGIGCDGDRAIEGHVFV